MTEPRFYLDFNASAPLLEQARDAMVAALDATGNPSSVHAEGRAARRIVEDARRDVAELAGAKPDQVIFTSGATEAASTLLTQAWRMGRSELTVAHLFVCEADHPCVLDGGHFPRERTTRLPVNADGVIDLERLEKALSAFVGTDETPLVAVHAANNETGVIQPLDAISRIARRAGGIVVADAVQAAGRLAIDMSKGYADYLILSSHKIGGPKGAGAIVGNSDLLMPAPLVRGGGQEKGHRAGTENLPAIAGFGAAARVAARRAGDMAAVRMLRDRFEAAIRNVAPDAVFYGANAERLANTSFFAVPGVKAETAQIAFDLAGVALSAGSACSSGKVGPSHVLRAMGFGEDAGALRVSIGPETGEADLAAFAEALTGLVSRRRNRREAA